MIKLLFNILIENVLISIFSWYLAKLASGADFTKSSGPIRRNNPVSAPGAGVEVRWSLDGLTNICTTPKQAFPKAKSN